MSSERFEHYELLRHPDGTLWELGRGAMGVTYKAFDTRLRTPVALKVISAALLSHDPTARERFLREARTAARLRHPNVATVLHLGGTEAGGEAFYAMEFIAGETLAERVNRTGPLPADLVVDIGLEVALALAAAHEQGLIHRDLKPANLMLLADAPGTVTPSSGGSATGRVRVKVIDFGLAKAAADAGPLTRVGDFLGTPQFASPEQLNPTQADTDTRSDIYSLGVTLWYALTGKLPFPGVSLSEQRGRKASQTLPTAQLDLAGVPPQVARLLDAMLAADPADRPQTPHELLADLRRCRAEWDALSPSPKDFPTPLPPLAPPRPWLPVALFGVAALALIAVGAGAGWLRSGPLSKTSRAESVAATTAAVPEKSIAVLPFKNLSAEKDNAFFTDGVQDEILTYLAKVADLKVISRTSTAQYASDAPRDLPAIAAQLGVVHLLEGSVRRAGNQVRVSARLIDARTGVQLWAENYDRPLDDVFAIQSNIAQSIAGQLQARLSPAERLALSARPTDDVEAFDAYLRAQDLFLSIGSDSVQSREKLPRIVGLLDAAVARDPKFLAAWCLLTRVHASAYFQGADPTPARLELAGRAVQAAVQLQPNAGETHLALSDYYYSGFRDYPRARAELELARRSLPNRAEIYESAGYIDRRAGHWVDALHNLLQAIELDPRNFTIPAQVSMTYQHLHDFAAATRFHDRALSIVPGDPPTRVFRATMEIDAHANVVPYQQTLAEVLTKDPALARDLEDPLYSLCERTPAAMKRFLANTPQEGLPNSGVIVPHAYWEGVVARWEKDAARTQRAFTAARAEVVQQMAAGPETAGAVSLLGLIDAGLGRKEEAIREGRRACEMLPVSKDAIDGAFLAGNLAQILAWTGDKEAAVDQLIVVESRPNVLSYGLLKLHPVWDDLRGHPRFEKLVTELEKRIYPN